MSEVEATEVRWFFRPADLFEVAVAVPLAAFEALFSNGEVIVRLSEPTSNISEGTLRQMQKAVEGILNFRTLLAHRPHTLSGPTIFQRYRGGRADAEVHVCGLEEDAHVGLIEDAEVRDQNGEVVFNSRSERIAQQTTLLTRASRHLGHDATLQALTKSYSEAVKDPANELVHLYEIREALSVKFGGEMATLSALGLSSSAWSRLGQLSNNEPLRQGRHRGKTGGALRDATDAELSEAREIARAMIEAYLGHLANSSRPGDPR